MAGSRPQVHVDYWPKSSGFFCLVTLSIRQLMWGSWLPPKQANEKVKMREQSKREGAVLFSPNVRIHIHHRFYQFLFTRVVSLNPAHIYSRGLHNGINARNLE